MEATLIPLTLWKYQDGELRLVVDMILQPANDTTRVMEAVLRATSNICEERLGETLSHCSAAIFQNKLVCVCVCVQSYMQICVDARAATRTERRATTSLRRSAGVGGGWGDGPFGH